jgi:predicted  nucleic acid-binding Zn-ribbon protein
MKNTREVNEIIKNAKKIALLEGEIKKLRHKKRKIKGRLHEIDDKISSLSNEMKSREASLELIINA